MKWLQGLILPFLVLQLCHVYSATNTGVDTGCIVKEKIVFTIQEDIPINISFFITPDDPITFQVAIVGLKSSINNDLITLKPKSGEILRNRDGKLSELDINLNHDIPIGWNNMTITLKNDGIHLGDIYTLTGFKYDVNDISFTAKYVTNCAKRTPTWTISKSSYVSIPLIGSSYFGIKLQSYQPFQPVFVLNNISFPLSYDGGLTLGASTESLPANDYQIVLVKENKMISIFTISEMGEEYNLILKGSVKKGLVDLKVKTDQGDFFLILDPFLKKGYEVETRISIQSIELQENNTESTNPQPKVEESFHSKENHCKCTWQILIAIASGISVTLLMMLIKNYYFRRTKKEKNKELDLEEGESLLVKMDEVPVKYTIKQKYTEECGEFNPQFPLYQKEICKLKLITDKKHKNKWLLGEFDETKQTKVILVVGETRSGKSSAINGMINYVYGITYEDPFRFKLVHDMDLIQSPGTNTTKEITSYYIPFIPGIANDSNYVLIDTPGFGDSRGVEEDRKLISDFYHFLQKNQDIDEVDGIVFVIKASDTRLTDIQQYVINGLFSMFGKDVKRNIYVLVSFSDGSVTRVPKLLTDYGLEYKFDIHFNDNGMYNENVKFGDTSQESDEKIQKYFDKNWKMAMSNMDKLFISLKKIKPVSLLLTHVVLEENKDISKLTDELLELMEKENISKDEDKSVIRTSIEAKLDEARKLSERLKYIPFKENPLTINYHINLLIQCEKDGEKIRQLTKLKEKNTIFQNLLKKKE